MRMPLSAELRVVLESLDEPDKLMGAVLDHALFQNGASRGLIFDRERVVRSVGYSAGDRVHVWRVLDCYLLESNGVVRASQPYFCALQQDQPAYGVAGALTGPCGIQAVLAIEKDTPLKPSEVDDFTDWIGLAGKPLDVSLIYARWKREIHRQPLRLRDLPIEDLEQIPNLAEVERLLIAVAMNRNQNNKGRAAAALGISREGLRKRLLREST